MSRIEHYLLSLPFILLSIGCVTAPSDGGVVIPERGESGSSYKGPPPEATLERPALPPEARIVAALPFPDALRFDAGKKASLRKRKPVSPIRRLPTGTLAEPPGRQAPLSLSAQELPSPLPPPKAPELTPVVPEGARARGKSGAASTNNRGATRITRAASAGAAPAGESQNQPPTTASSGRESRPRSTGVGAPSPVPSNLAPRALRPGRDRQGSAPQAQGPGDHHRQGSAPKAASPRADRQGPAPQAASPRGDRQGSAPQAASPRADRQGSAPQARGPGDHRQRAEPQASEPGRDRQGPAPARVTGEPDRGTAVPAHPSPRTPRPGRESESPETASPTVGSGSSRRLAGEDDGGPGESYPYELLETSHRTESEVGEELLVRLPGEGWLYLGEEGQSEDVRFVSQREGEGQTLFRFRISRPGAYELQFQRQELFSGRVREHRLEVEALPPGGSEPNGALASRPEEREPTDTVQPRESSAVSQPRRESREPARGEVAAARRNDGVAEERPTVEEGSVSEERLESAGQVASPAPLEWPDDFTAEALLQDPDDTFRRLRESEEYDAVSLADMMARRGEPRGALSLLEAYQGREDRDLQLDEVWFRMAQLLEREEEARDLRRAVALYDRVVDEYPLSDYYELSRQRAEYLKRHFFLVR